MDVCYPCYECPDIFSSRNSFVSHMKNIHQNEVPNLLNECSTETCDTHQIQFEDDDFESALSEFQSISDKIREHFISNPIDFKKFIEFYVSTLKNNLTSDKSLFLACHKLLNHINQSDSD